MDKTEQSKCEKIDVCRIGRVQDIGVVIQIKEGVISSISDNAYRYPWISLENMVDVIGMRVEEVVTEIMLSSIYYLCKSNRLSLIVTGENAGSPRKGECPDVTVSISEHVNRTGFTCVFFEPVRDSCLVVQYVHRNMKVDCVNSSCEYLRHSMGYDRGFVYKFLDDCTGAVVHESVNSDVKYHGLRFPSGDIPAKVRRQYLVDRVRFISDTEKTQSDIIGDSMNLSSCNIRGVASPHMEYMKNLGVRSSLSIGLVINEDLWGLLVFHSWERVIIPSSQDLSVMTMTSSIISTQLEKKITSEWIQKQLELDNLLHGENTHGDIRDFITHNEENLLRIFACNTVCYNNIEQGGFMSVGDSTISPEEFDLINFDSICTYGKMENPTRFYVSISHSKFFVMFIRVGYVGNVVWGGDPSEKLENPLNGEMLPRKSFDAFVKKTAQRPTWWNKMDKSMITSLSKALDKMVYQSTLNETKERMKEMQSAVEHHVDTNTRDQSFFAHMSHELRTPFHGVMSILQLLQDDKIDPDERAKYIKIAIECGETMMNTLNDILSISKGKSSYVGVGRNFDLMSVLNSTTDVLNQMASSKGVTVQILFELEEMLTVHGDAVMIKQLVANFYSNAIKFTPPGGTVIVTVKVFDTPSEALKECEKRSAPFDGKYVAVDRYEEERYDQEYIHVTISVTDTGCGIPSEQIPKVFTAYHQVSSGDEKIYQGSGLGLNICMLNALRLKARLAVGSTVGTGTYINCTLPLIKVNKIEDEEKVQGAVPEIHKGAPTAPVIIVVDDSVINVKLATKHILNVVPKAQVHSSSNGLEGYNLYKELVRGGAVVCGVFMDYHMPIMSGLDSISKIRAYESSHRLRHTYIVAFTADLTDASAQKLVSAGAVKIVKKPTGKNDIGNACIEMLNSFR